MKINGTEIRYFFKWKEALKHKEEVKDRMMKQIQHLLVENKQLADELEEANRTISVYINMNDLSTVKKKTEVEV